MWARACEFVVRCWRGQWYEQAILALVGLIVAGAVIWVARFIIPLFIAFLVLSAVFWALRHFRH
jgi:hypothetical protein